MNRIKLSKEQKEQIKAFEQKLIQDEMNKQMLINRNTDFGLLENLIQKVNDNPNLIVEVNIADGTKLKLHTYNNKNRRTDQIDGNILEIQ